jgi:prepilin-type N-terminal cleavage/methylation domain-containing protein
MSFLQIGYFRRSPVSGFTILELLVAMSVLALLVVMVAQITNSASATVAGSRKHMDADNQARAIFDRLATDIGKMVRRGDVDSIVKGSNSDAPGNPPTMPGNDAMFFFSEAPGFWSIPTPSPAPSTTPSPKSPVTLVGYRINESATAGAPAYALERLGSAIPWESEAGGSGVAFLTRANASSTPAPGSTIATGWSGAVGSIANNYKDGTSTDYQAIGEGVFRLEYCYLLKDGTFSNTPFLAPHTTAQGLQDVSAIVVALAIMDSNSRKIAPDLEKLSQALPDASPPTLMAEAWKNAITSPNFASSAGIPQAAAGQVRIYQRFFYLNNMNSL